MQEERGLIHIYTGEGKGNDGRTWTLSEGSRQRNEGPDRQILKDQRFRRA